MIRIVCEGGPLDGKAIDVEDWTEKEPRLRVEIYRYVGLNADGLPEYTFERSGDASAARRN